MSNLQAHKAAGRVTVAVNFSTDEVGAGFEYVLGGGGVAVLTAPGQLTLDPLKASSILLNATGSNATFILPDGSEGFVKEVVNGQNGRDTDSFIYLQMTNNMGNNGFDLNLNMSARFVWSTASGGWVILSACNAVNNFWD